MYAAFGCHSYSVFIVCKLFFGLLVIVSVASAIGLSVVTNRYMLHNASELLSVGFLGVQPISGDCKERVTLCSGFSGEKRPEWVIRAKP